MRYFKDHVNSTFFFFSFMTIEHEPLWARHCFNGFTCINLPTTLWNFLKQRKLRQGKVKY